MHKSLTKPIAKEEITENSVAEEQKDCSLGIVQQENVAFSG